MKASERNLFYFVMGVFVVTVILVSAYGRGPRGAQGPLGPVGLRGAEGPHPPVKTEVGPTGARGLTGPSGDYGLHGVPGATGPTAAYTDVVPTMRPWFSSGFATNEGSGPYTLTLGIPSARPFQLGTVTTLVGAPGSNADVTTSIDGSNFTNFVFTLPEGLTGEEGPSGIQGLPGPTGPIGLLGVQGPDATDAPSGPTGPSGPLGALFPLQCWSYVVDTFTTVNAGVDVTFTTAIDPTSPTAYVPGSYTTFTPPYEGLYDVQIAVEAYSTFGTVTLQSQFANNTSLVFGESNVLQNVTAILVVDASNVNVSVPILTASNTNGSDVNIVYANVSINYTSN